MIPTFPLRNLRTGDVLRAPGNLLFEVCDVTGNDVAYFTSSSHANFPFLQGSMNGRTWHLLNIDDAQIRSKFLDQFFPVEIVEDGPQTVDGPPPPFGVGDRVRLKAPGLGRSYADIGKVTYVDETGHVSVRYDYYEVDKVRGYSPDQIELVSRAEDEVDEFYDDPRNKPVDYGPPPESLLDITAQAEEHLREVFDILAGDVVATISAKVMPENPTRGLHLLSEVIEPLQRLRRVVADEPDFNAFGQMLAPAGGAPGQANAFNGMLQVFENAFAKITAPKPKVVHEPSFYDLQQAMAIAEGFGDLDMVEKIRAVIKRKYTEMAKESPAETEPGELPVGGLLGAAIAASETP